MDPLGYTFLRRDPESKPELLSVTAKGMRFSQVCHVVLARLNDWTGARCWISHSFKLKWNSLFYTDLTDGIWQFRDFVSFLWSELLDFIPSTKTPKQTGWSMIVWGGLHLGFGRSKFFRGFLICKHGERWPHEWISPTDDDDINASFLFGDIWTCRHPIISPIGTSFLEKNMARRCTMDHKWLG